MRTRRGVGLAAGLVAALAVAACSVDPSTTATEPGASASADPAQVDDTEGAAADTGRTPAKADAGAGKTGAGSTFVVADPAHAVPLPGPRDRSQAIAPPDVMVYNAEEPLSDEVVQQISDLEGVESVSRLSMAQVSLENRVYTVAAVDPASYRLFTDPVSAASQQQWDRVAGGEVSLTNDKSRPRPAADRRRRLPAALGRATPRPTSTSAPTHPRSSTSTRWSTPRGATSSASRPATR